MKKLITFVLCFFVSLSQANEIKDDGGCLELEIVIIADLSASVGGHEDFIHAAVYSIINKFDLADNGIRVGLITFNTTATLISSLSSSKDSLTVAANVIAPFSAQGTTNLTHALELSLQEFVTNGRKGVIKMAILITDGEPDNFQKTEQTASLLKSLPGTYIWGIFVKTDAPWKMYTNVDLSTIGVDYLKRIASPNCFIESDYKNLIEQINKLDICL